MAAVVYSFRDPPGRVNDLIEQLLESGSSYELKVGSAVAILGWRFNDSVEGPAQWMRDDIDENSCYVWLEISLGGDATLDSLARDLYSDDISSWNRDEVIKKIMPESRDREISSLSAMFPTEALAKLEFGLDLFRIYCWEGTKSSTLTHANAIRNSLKLQQALSDAFQNRSSGGLFLHQLVAKLAAKCQPIRVIMNNGSPFTPTGNGLLLRLIADRGLQANSQPPPPTLTLLPTKQLLRRLVLPGQRCKPDVLDPDVLGKNGMVFQNQLLHTLPTPHAIIIHSEEDDIVSHEDEEPTFPARPKPPSEPVDPGKPTDPGGPGGACAHSCQAGMATFNVHQKPEVRKIPTLGLANMGLTAASGSAQMIPKSEYQEAMALSEEGQLAEPVLRFVDGDNPLVTAHPDIQQSAKGFPISLHNIPGRTCGDTAESKQRVIISSFKYLCSPVADSRIYLGGESVAKSSQILRDQNITHILNTAGDVCPNYHQGLFDYFTVVLEDNRYSAHIFESIIPACLNFINETLTSDNKNSVLVHCREGVSRSAAVVVAYLMWAQNLSFRQALDQVVKARSICSPNTGFTFTLLRFVQTAVVGPQLYRIALHNKAAPFLVALPLPAEGSPVLLDPRFMYLQRNEAEICVWSGPEIPMQFEKLFHKVVDQFAADLSRLGGITEPLTVKWASEEGFATAHSQRHISQLDEEACILQMGLPQSTVFDASGWAKELKAGLTPIRIPFWPPNVASPRISNSPEDIGSTSKPATTPRTRRLRHSKSPSIIQKAPKWTADLPKYWMTNNKQFEFDQLYGFVHPDYINGEPVEDDEIMANNRIVVFAQFQRVKEQSRIWLWQGKDAVLESDEVREAIIDKFCDVHRIDPNRVKIRWEIQDKETTSLAELIYL